MYISVREAIAYLLVLAGLIFLIKGIYDLGYYHGMEAIREGESGLGGFAEWAEALIEMTIGVVVSLIGFIISRVSSKNKS